MSSDIGVKDYHESNIINFMRFSRAQRGLSVKTLQGVFKDIEYAKLRDETTLTCDEVQDILLELWDTVKEEIDTELAHQSHTYILLMRQMFIQAEHWHLKLQADISELENKELLDRVKNFEEEQFSSRNKSKQTPRLEPVNDSGGTLLLREKIDSLQDENVALRKKISALESNLIDYNERGASKNSKSSSSKGRKYTDDEIDEMERKMDDLRMEMSHSRDLPSKNEKHIESELTSIKHRYLEIQDQLRMAEKELERKFNQTNAYKNMKQMLDKKNGQIKDLRRRLNRFEPPED